MKAKLTLMSVLFIFALTQISFGNGLSLNSIGPKSLGMGGAFVGVADDYTAMYWNPAGITQLNKMQVGLFVTDIIPASTYKNSQENIDVTSETNHYISPNIMAYIPLMNGDLTVGFGVYVPAGLGTEWNGENLISTNLSGGEKYDWMSKIAAFNITPGVAYKIMDNLSIGVAMNIYYGMFEIKRPHKKERVKDEPSLGYVWGQYKEESSGMGFGFSGGVLWKPIDDLSVGLSFKSKSSIAFTGTANNSMLVAAKLDETDFERDVEWPMWYAAGIAYKPINGLTLAFDAQFSQWSATQEKLVTNYTDWEEKKIITSDEDREMLLLWKDCWQIRFGANYELTKELQVRAGFYHDPAPAPNETMNILFPSNTYEGITVGASYAICPSMGIDFGFEYLMGDTREITFNDYLVYEKAMTGEHHTDIIALSLGFCYTIQ